MREFTRSNDGKTKRESLGLAIAAALTLAALFFYACGGPSKLDRASKEGEASGENAGKVEEKNAPLGKSGEDAPSVPPVPASAGIDKETSFTLVYSTGLGGELVDCGCPGHPRGGMARRAQFVKDIAHARPVLQVDGGGAFFSPNKINMKPAPKDLDGARVIARSYARMGISAVNVSKFDLAGGIDFLKNDVLAKEGKGKLPLVSANLVKDGQLVFPPFSMVKSGEASIGVFGVSDSAMSLPGGRPDLEPAYEPGVRFLDPKESAARMVAALKGKCDLIVGLYGMDLRTASTIAKEVPGVDIIVVSDRGGAKKQRPLVIGDTLLLQAGDRGMFLGRMEVTLFPGGVKEEISETLRRDMKDELERITAQKAAFAGSIGRDPEVRSRLRTIEKEEERILERLRGSKSRFDYDNALVSVDLDFPEDPEVAAWVQAIGVEARTTH